jgi:hypothetical protein
VPAAFVAHPLAASRLLARLYGDEAELPKGLDGAATFTASASAVVRQPLALAPDACADVAVAIGAAGSGLDLHLTGANVGGDTIARGRFVVGDRVCAGDPAGEPMAEIRLATGSDAALLLTRVLPP